MAATRDLDPATDSDRQEQAGILRNLGVDEDDIQRELFDTETEGRVPFEVWPDNWPALELFLHIAGSWRYHGMSGRVAGLDETALHIRLQVMGEALNLTLYDDVVRMGRIAAQELNNRLFD